MSTAAVPDAVPRAPAAPGPAPEETGQGNRVFQIAQQVFLMWAVSQLVSRYFLVSKAPTPAVVQSPSGVAVPVDPRTLRPTSAVLTWIQPGKPIDMHVHLSTSPTGDVFSSKWTSKFRENADEELPSFVWENIKYGDWKDSRTVDYNITLPKLVQNNGSLWADIFIAKDGASPDPNAPNFDPASIHHIRKLLTPYLPKAKVIKEKNLLSGTPDTEEVEEEVIVTPQAIVSHWSPNVTLALVSEPAVLPLDKLPPAIIEHIHWVQNERDETGTKALYKPIVFPNEFWHIKSHYIELNSTVTTVPLQITFQPMSYMKFQLFATLTAGFAEAAKQQGAGAGAELDEVKRMLVETNPYFLFLTGFVSLLHVLFEMLAFKSDVSHWRQKKEMVGISVRTIVTNVFVQLIILLYLIDNNTDTSWMILFGSGTGVLIEAWKITKAVDIKIEHSAPDSWAPFKIVVTDKHVLSEDEKKTQEYDKLAFRYVSWVAIPTLAAYTVYSLIYNTHKGWYSFVISTLTSFVYMFGFAQLVPQLIINYKLKSVSHMPMKAMIYKTLSTVVDDFFAFCIKMPWLHRLACFRDDVVFLIFLYQRWIYRVDTARVNEYGQVMTPEEVAAAQDVAKDETKKNK